MNRTDHPQSAPSPGISPAARLAPAVLLALGGTAGAYDVNDQLSIGATLTGVYQHGAFDDPAVDDTGRGTVVTDIELGFAPTDHDEFAVVLSFAVANGLNAVSPLGLASYADDLEDDLEDINGRGRDHLLAAWYRRSFELTPNAAATLTGGIIDSTEYLDDNAFANDEGAQFMNDIFVNSTLMNLPSYDIGAAGTLALGAHWSLSAVWMTSKNVDSDNALDRSFHYAGAQIAYHHQSSLGEGNLRVMGHATSDDFADPTGARTEGLSGVGVSADQQLGEAFGVFARLGWQSDDAAVDHDAVYSAGVSISGNLWNRPDDEAGIGYARLDGGNTGLDHTDAVEAFVRLHLNDHSDLSFDVQHLSEEPGAGADTEAWIFGVRAVASF